MSKLPVIDAKTFEKLLLKMGFEIKRQKGSHVFYRHPDKRYTTLPHHRGRVLGRPLIRKILREIKVTPEEFKQQLENL